MRPRVAFGGALESLRGERVDPRPEQGEDRRQDDKRKGGCDQRDERAGDPHRAKEQLREDRERRDRGGDRERAEHDRPARGRERAAQRVDAEAVDGGFLAVAGDHEQAVVDREPEPEAGHHVEREHRQVGEARDDPQREEGRQDREASEQRRQQRRDERTEEQQGEQEDERERKELGACEVVTDLRVGLRARDRVSAELDVGVSGELALQALGVVLDSRV